MHKSLFYENRVKRVYSFLLMIGQMLVNGLMFL